MTARFRTSVVAVGFSPPPVPLRLKLIQATRYWTLFLQPVGPASMGSIVDWLEPWVPLRVEFGSRSVLRADFDPLPVPWKDRFGSVALDMLHLFPSGDAFATVTGTRDALAGFGSHLRHDGGATTHVERVGVASRQERLLTPAQDHVLREAVAAGYYRIPRPINLLQLALQLGISSSTLSETLRRAEARILTRFVNEGGRSPWDDQTLYDAYPERSQPTPQAVTSIATIATLDDN